MGGGFFLLLLGGEFGSFRSLEWVRIVVVVNYIVN